MACSQVTRGERLFTKLSKSTVVYLSKTSTFLHLAINSKERREEGHNSTIPYNPFSFFAKRNTTVIDESDRNYCTSFHKTCIATVFSFRELLISVISPVKNRCRRVLTYFYEWIIQIRHTTDHTNISTTQANNYLLNDLQKKYGCWI